VIRALLAALTILAGAPLAVAQTPDPAPRAHRFTLSGGASWSGGYPVGGNTATLRRNEPGTIDPNPFTLFRADASIKRALGVEARIGYALTRAFELEVGGVFARPQVAVRISQDQEADPVVLSDEDLRQFVVEGNLVWHLSRPAFGTRARPYLTAGAGHLWQLYEDRVKVETGTLAHVGGGVRYWLRGGDTSRRALGLRGEVRLQLRSGGVEFEDRVRLFPAVQLKGFFGF
jgi:hypothetical protein